MAGKVLYDYIQTYTEMLPTAIELQEALADSRVTVAASGTRSYITGLKGKFEWGDWSLFDLLPIKRGFELRLKVKMIESGEMQKVKSISAKITNEHGVALDAKQFKFKIGKAEQNDTLLTQPITVQLKVLSFGNSSTGGGISKTIGVSYSESVPIGSAEYNVECEFEQYGTVASFRSLNAGTATNLPQLKLSFPAQIQLKKK
ncbi:MAG: hypothetical protein GY810_28260 [Aureispira sp.]|nr:hypothetical protein [Aureispira sp.]